MEHEAIISTRIREQYIRFVVFKTALLSKNKLKSYQQLHSKKFRQKYGLFVVEGLKSVRELLNSDWTVDCILCTRTEWIDSFSDSDIPLHLIDDKAFKSVSGLSTPSGVLAIVKQKEQKLSNSGWQIAVDQLNDPGNLGSIIRVADWYGIKDILCSTDSVELYNSKTIQASMGSFLRVNVVHTDLNKALQSKVVYATLLEGLNIREVEPKEGVILIGGEANGIREELLNTLDHQAITIPGHGRTESLNAGIATAICCERLLF